MNPKLVAAIAALARLAYIDELPSDEERDRMKVLAADARRELELMRQELLVARRREAEKWR